VLTAVVAFIAAVAILISNKWGSSPTGDQTGTNGSSSPGDQPGNNTPDGSDAVTGVMCSSCVVSGEIVLNHPSWGNVKMTLSQPPAMVPIKGDSQIVVTDAAGTVRWRRIVGAWQKFAPANPPVDRLGHVFLEYSTTRYEGVIVLALTAYGFNDFGSLPHNGSDTTLYYPGEAVDIDGDGVNEIRSIWNDCKPDCGGGTMNTTIFRWDGQGYVESRDKG